MNCILNLESISISSFHSKSSIAHRQILKNNKILIGLNKQN